MDEYDRIISILNDNNKKLKKLKKAIRILIKSERRRGAPTPPPVRKGSDTTDKWWKL